MHIHAPVCVQACRISDLVSAARLPMRSWSWISWGWQWCSAGSERWVDMERLVFAGTPRLLLLQYPEGRYQSEHPGTWPLVQHNLGFGFAAEWGEKKQTTFAEAATHLPVRLWTQLNKWNNWSQATQQNEGSAAWLQLKQERLTLLPICQQATECFYCKWSL